MGKFRSKLKGQTKGKRWPKGQSSISNPETHKYRDLAKSRFFQTDTVSSGLTVAQLQHHDAVQSFEAPKESAVPETVMEAEDNETFSESQISYGTIDSFASDWSGCTSMSFNRFLKIFRSDSALHKEMLAILAAIKEVITENKGTESPTEYFCALLTTLDEVYKAKDNMQITAVLFLLSMGIKTVPIPVLRAQFSDTSRRMLTILQDYVAEENNAIIKAIIEVLAQLLSIQDGAVWTNSSTKQIFNAILSPFCIHSKPKWRKAAISAVKKIVRSDSFKEAAVNIPADDVSKFCEQTLNSCLGNEDVVKISSIQSNQTRILHVLGLMKETICFFPKSKLKSSCELLLRLMTLNYSLVTSCSLQVLHTLFSAQSAVVPAKLNAQIINALYDYQPAVTDVQPTLAWLVTMQQAHVHLSDVDIALSCAALPKVVNTFVQLWLSDKPQIMSATTYSLDVIIKDALLPACATKESVEQYKSKIVKIFNTIEMALGYQYNKAWHQVLHVVGVMFEVAGANCSDLLASPLKTLSELRDSYKFTYNNELEHAVGAAVRSMGPEIVLNVIPLKKENGELSIERSWMLPVLKENIKISTLDFFVKGILSLALNCQRRSAQLAAQNDGIGAHSAELLYLQLWNLLPCFCNEPIDIKDNFKSIAKVLGTAISDRKELRLAVMASLRRLIMCAQRNQNEADLKELARFDKNYLPILFNLYTTKPIGTDEEGQRLAALDTIKLYLTISRPDLNEQLLHNAIERLNASSDDPEDPFIKESILDLIRALVPYQTVENIAVLYAQCVKPLPSIKNNKEQKKAYRILEEICGCESEECKKFLKQNRKDVQGLLMKSLDLAAVSSKGARLRCLHYLIKAQPRLDHESKLVRSVIPEAVLCCKDINERCRTVAYDILNTIGEMLVYNEQDQKFLMLVVAGLSGTPQMKSCTVLALTSLLHTFSGSLGQENIKNLLESIGLLIQSQTREIVGSCLSFIKVYLKALPSPVVASSLPTIMKSLTSMTEDCKKHFRLRVRDILDRLVRKYGCESITPYVSSNDTVMYKRLRNLRKINARKKRQRSSTKDHDSDEEKSDEFLINSKAKSVHDILADSDSDNNFDDIMETNQPKVVKSKKKMNTWIEENADTIVDFKDPSVVSKITATKPGQSMTTATEKKAEKDRGFKIANDGRLIIKDVSSDEESDKKKKDFVSFDDSDSDEDNKSTAETLILRDRKRKRSSASVVSGLSKASSQPPSKYKPGGVGIHRRTQSSAASVISKASGHEYRSKKAKGDVKQKGKFDPYAYVPLQRNTLNKRKKSKAAGAFKNIIKSAKKGALKGAKAKKKGVSKK